MEDDQAVSAWDEQWAVSIIGATVLVGITWVEGDGASSTEQMFGIIKRADARDGFEVALGGMRAGEVFWLPPDIRNFRPASPGDYRLRSTGEIVIDPDFTATWTVHRRTT